MKAAFAKNTKEQREALGCFIEAFELMVNEVRGICIDNICAFHGEDERKHLVEIAFHHQAMTAKPLFDVMRAIVAEIVNAPTSPHHADRAIFKAVVGRISKEYSHLYEKRNELVHGTWLIGYAGWDDPDANEFYVQKFKTSADGLVGVSDLPKTAAELLDLAKACEDLRDWLSYLDSCFRDWNRIRITDVFEKRDEEWMLIVYEDAKALPKR